MHKSTAPTVLAAGAFVLVVLGARARASTYRPAPAMSRA